MKLKYGGSLHNHTDRSNFRLRDCIIKADQLIDYAIELGHEVLAITEHETISSSVVALKHYDKIKKDNPNFKLILGNEIYLCRNGLNKDNFLRGQDKYYHFILLAKNEIGHKQIRELSTRAWMRSYKTRGNMIRVPTYYNDLVEIIGKNPGHVIASTACLGGVLGTQLLEKKKETDEKLKKWCKQIEKIFGKGNFFLEMQPSENEEQIYVNNKIIEFSKELSIPHIITNDTHYLKKEDRSIHKAYLNSQNGDREVDAFYATTYLMNTEELESYMKISEEELQISYQNILKIKEMCEDYTLLKKLEIPYLPLNSNEPNLFLYDKYKEKIPYLKKFYSSEIASNRHLVRDIVEKIEKEETLRNIETYNEINSNLKSVWDSSNAQNVPWSAYLLNIKDCINLAWQAGTLVGPARGSVTGFLLAYVLDITQINPLREKTKMFAWRFLNPERASVLDIDVDIEGGRREDVIRVFQKTHGADRVTKVLAIRTEKAKSSILTAARGLGIDIDIAQYLSSMVKSPRGMQQTLEQTFYGDIEEGIKPNREFVKEMTNNYPELWRVAKNIEGLCSGVSAHAGGVIFTEKPFTEVTALMKTNNGDIITQFDLHEAEDVGLIKVDLLSIEALDKIHVCLDLLIEAGHIKPGKTLRETYENVIGIYNIKREDMKMWEKVWNHEIISLFQMEQQSGIQGIELTKPKTVDELAVLNSVIRLMAAEKGQEQPLNKFARFKNDINLWYREMEDHGLTKEEMKILEPILKNSYGICETQEKFMALVQIPECGGFSLLWADRLRKSIAKKLPKEYDELTKEYYEAVEEKNLSLNLCKYVWDVLVATSRGYGFNASHTLSYSLIALQEMNLATYYPTIYWNCACLISDSKGIKESEYEEEEEEKEEVYKYNFVEEFFTEEEDEEDSEEEDNESNPKKKEKKKASKTSDYGKVATAIGKFQSDGIIVYPPNINKSKHTFYPDEENNRILYGISGIVGIGQEIVNEIIAQRPYSSFENLREKVKLKKPQIINLIKSGALSDFGDRKELMHAYLIEIADLKKRLTMQNLAKLIEYNFISREDFDFEIRLFNFNKYLKKTGYKLNQRGLVFYENYFDIDKLEPIAEEDFLFKISKETWKALYDKKMLVVKKYIKDNQKELLHNFNEYLYNLEKEKYASGNFSKWEMDSISYYYTEHELANIDYEKEGFTNYFSLPEDPHISRSFTPKNGNYKVNLYELSRIAGTVLDKDKNKNLVTILTREGVVTIRIFGDAFNNYNRQISIKNPLTGKKKVIEKSWFSRGNKIIVTGVKINGSFQAKKYSKTPYHLVELIESIDEKGNITVKTEREEE